MNAAAKALHQSNLFHGHIREIRFSFIQCLQMILFLTVFVNAVVVIYCTNQYRISLSQLEKEQQQTNILELEWGQLLLEQASISAPSRIQEQAEEVLHMNTPTSKQTVVIRVP
jgi:cell division protein FtsL